MQLYSALNLDLNDKAVISFEGGKDVEIFIDVYKQNPKLLISGGGHVGYEIYKAACLLDFDVVVFDDREEFLNKEIFPLTKELVLGLMHKKLKEYNINENTYIVIVTRGHSLDQQCLEVVANTNAKYIGAMGSKKKIITTMKNLIELGYSEEVLNKVYAPIGLDISTNKPSEIAVSILGEILRLKNEGQLVNRKLKI